MAREETPISLSKDIQGNSQQANRNLDRCNSNEDVLDATVNKPLVAAPSQAKRKDILEDHHARKGFDRNFAWLKVRRVTYAI
jgi:hypothetical protein